MSASQIASKHQPPLYRHIVLACCMLLPYLIPALDAELRPHKGRRTHLRTSKTGCIICRCNTSNASLCFLVAAAKCKHLKLHNHMMLVLTHKHHTLFGACPKRKCKIDYSAGLLSKAHAANISSAFIEGKVASMPAKAPNSTPR